MDSNLSRMNPLAESTLIGTDEFRNHNKRKTLSPLMNTSSIRPRISNLNIDPSVLTNAQSKGIVRRLISYHEESQNDNNRNRYVYNRYGDFPIVHLKKTELKRNLVRSSSVRIAPPSKMNFNREARAAILRSNSFQMGAFGLNSTAQKLAPVRMKAQDTSHQIITNHEPISLEEPPQTSKSVLEALEKNCRKRINIEELIMDRQKRICPPVQHDFEIPSIVANSLAANQSTKRARASPEKSVTDSGISQQVKRFRVKNNALLSSLSSSHYELIPKSNGHVKKPQQVNKILTPPVVQKLQEPIQPAQQPSPQVKKLRLFNVQATQPPPNFRKNRHNFDDSDDDGEVKLHFVKPKEKPSNIDFDSNQKVEKEKLSRMLHSLGDGCSRTTSEYVGPVDTVDAKKTVEPVKSSAALSFTTTTTTTVSSAPISSPISSGSATISAPQISFSSSVVSPVEVSKSAETKTVEIQETKKSEEPKISTPLLPAIPSIISTEKSAEKPAGISFGLGSFTATTSVASTTSNTLSLPKPTLPLIDANKSSLISFSPAPASKETSVVKPSTDNVPVLGGFSFSATPVKDTDKPSLPSFQFGASQATSIPSVVTTSSPAPSSTPNLFGSIAATTSAPSTVPSFSFGASNTAVTTSSTLPTLSQPPTISFGQQNKPETTQSSGVGFSFGSSTTVAPVSTSANGGFSFGASATAPKPTAAVGGFSFGGSQNKTDTPTLGFGQNSTQSTAAPTSALGMFQSPPNTVAPKTDNAGIFSRLGGKAVETNANAPPSFNFGASDKKNPISLGFENKTEVKTFGFGNEKKSDAPPSFGSIQNSSENKPISTFSFGGQKPAENKTAFSFGGEKPAESSAFSFGADKPAEVKSTFSFGGSQEKKDAPPSFNFGGNAEKQDAPPAFNFGGAKPQEPAKISFNLGGDNKNELPKPSFGSNTSGGSIFGAAVKPFTSKPDATPTFGQNSMPTFGQSTPSFNAPSVTPVFGSNNSQQQNPPAFGSNSSTMFGGNNNSTPSFNQPQSTFGNNQQSNSTSGGMFSFGQANKPSQPTAQSPPTGSVFSFGNNSAAPATQVPQSNIFGGGNSEQNVSASFSFKPSTGIASTNSSSGIFNSNQNAQQSAFNFGGVTNASASFTFSPSSATTGNSQQPPAFNFNGPQTAPAISTGAFNFQAQQQQQQQGMMMSGGGQNNTGFFSIGVGGGAQKRPIRQATRRLK